MRLRSAYEVADALERSEYATLLALAFWGQQPVQDEVTPGEVAAIARPEWWALLEMRICAERLEALEDLREGGGPTALDGPVDVLAVQLPGTMSRYEGKAARGCMSPLTCTAVEGGAVRF